MSTVSGRQTPMVGGREALSTGNSVGNTAGNTVGNTVPAVRAWLRLLGSEAGLTFRRPRNAAMLGLLVVIPVLVGVALRVFGSPEESGPGRGTAILQQVTGNGLFLTFAALSILVQLLLPVVVAVVAGDSVAGEAGLGTLRYLLAVPAGRTRLLAVKYVNAVVFCLAAVTAVALSGLLTGLVLFPAGPITLLSGVTVPFAEGVLRIGVVVLYVTAGMAALAAVALALSTFTEVSIGAIASTVVVVIVAQVLGAIPQLAAIQPYLLTTWWSHFDGVLRAPVAVDEMADGLLVFGAYVVVFGSVAWARFTGKDITS
ncbi:ABC-2 type transport system permease protein [Streptosporangium becharense]|uniref:ABC-2 type transport system permease protein n=1 Tax=Streptosporangium becharense TaxID=1816182 RepID=A0A7W9MJV6_9ACTN|nr:ABC transporter permease [Streptosporangium becharense]MBB2910215.1 ABC-2 type transport system permease protein [Streptosporangium becharense]MBB5822958.1 ABC-2 type transport system permease protein [Streptosporangium becharense]